VKSRTIAVAAALVAASLVITACAAPSGTIPPRSTSQPPAAGSATPSVQPSPVPADGWWQPAGEPTTLAASLAAPWSVVPLPEGGALISERDTGTVRELLADGAPRTAGVVPGVVSGGESGLHGLALWKDERSQTWLYAYHGAEDDNRVVRMPLLGEPGSRSLGEAEPVFTGIPRNSTHNGGRIAFGPDGLLYVTTGDAQIRDAAQDVNALGGKILRITPDGAAAPGNPWGNAIWTLGHRNVQGITWTPDGRMWASEFGQDTWDELNEIVGGSNYGWPVVEGEGGDEEYTDPVIAWRTSEASPSGIAAVGGTVFVAGLRGERLWAVDVRENRERRAAAVLEGQGRLRDVVVAPDGALWLLTGNTDGRGSPRVEDDVLIRMPIAPQDD